MLVFPVGDENPTTRKPVINYLLIAANVIVFLGLGYSTLYEDIIRLYAFIPADAVPYTYLTSIFLHANLGHLLGNMLFLWIAGDNVEDALGHFWYLLFYLLGGAAANYFHALLATPDTLVIPAIGASGAISAVLGAYIVLFPRNRIIFFYFFWIIIFIRWGTFRIASLWAIGLWFLLQLLNQSSTAGISPVAYSAHIGGFMSGVVLIGMLAMMGLVRSYWRGEHTYTGTRGYPGPEEEETHPPENIPYGPQPPDYYSGKHRDRRDDHRDDYW